MFTRRLDLASSCLVIMILTSLALLKQGIYLRAEHLICQLIPAAADTDVGIQQIFRHHRGLRKLTQVENHTLSLGNQVEVAGEGIGKFPCFKLAHATKRENYPMSTPKQALPIESILDTDRRKFGS